MTSEQTFRSGRISLALPLQMLAGLLIGLVLALLWPSFATALQPIGTAFIEAIRMIIIPLLVASVTLGTYSHLWPNAEDRTRKAAHEMFTASLVAAADQLRTKNG